MSAFIPINLDRWPRREHFQHYYNQVPCSFSLTTKLDISRLKENKTPIQPALLFSITKIINRYPEFRLTFDTNHQLGYYEYLIPCFTFFHPQTQTFSTIWTDKQEDFASFLRQYRQDIASFGNNLHLEGKPHTPPYIFNLSTIPWCSFESFQLHLPCAKDYFIPIFTLGKYYQTHDSWFIPLSIQAHHAACDGFHISRLINELQQHINNF